MKYVTWPTDLEVRVYEITSANAERVAKSMKARTVDCVVVAQKIPNNHITRVLPRDICPVWVWIKNVHSLKDRLPSMLGFEEKADTQKVPASALLAAATAAATAATEQLDLADKPIYKASDLLADLIACDKEELTGALVAFHGGPPPAEQLYSFNDAVRIEQLVMERRGGRAPVVPTDNVIESRFCASSGERVALTKDEARAKAKACTRCGKVMRIRPAEGYATLPRHLRPELAAPSASVPFATTVRVDTTKKPESVTGDRVVIAGVALPSNVSTCHFKDASAAFVEVTPEMAAAWQARSAPNRNKREAHVEKLVRAMQAGEWLLTHQGVAFSTDDICIDGQHRLDAIVRFGRAVPMMVTWGLEPEVINVTDTGITRPVSDVLAIMGEPSARTKSAIFRAFARLVGAPDNKWSVQENMRFLEYARESVDWAMEAFSGHRKGTFKAPVIAPCMLVRASHPDEVEHFVAKLVGREEAMTSDPAIKLKITLQQKLMSSDGQRMDVARYVLGALNAAITGGDIKAIRPFSIKVARQRWMPGWIKKYGDWPFGFGSNVELEE